MLLSGGESLKVMKANVYWKNIYFISLHFKFIFIFEQNTQKKKLKTFLMFKLPTTNENSKKTSNNNNNK